MHHFKFDTTPLPPAPAPYNLGDAVGTYPPVHLVFVHGFRGDHTSFQRFPTDLHFALESKIPSLETHVYPVYKSRKPIQVSVERLMQWIYTLQPGYVILIGHSLGGFLVAEAAVQFPSKEGGHQIIGVIAMDVPYLGIHPHVIVSGILSLFPGADKTAEREQDLNDPGKVNMVQPQDPALSIASTPSALPDGSEWPSGGDQHSGNHLPLPDLTPGPTALQKSVQFFMQHKEDPLRATIDWIVGHWEHGSTLLDPDELRSRYHKLEHWKGDWINFYTETVPSEFARRKRNGGHSPNPTEHVLRSIPASHSKEDGSGPRAAHSDSVSTRASEDEGIKAPEPTPFQPLALPEVEEQLKVEVAAAEKNDATSPSSTVQNDSASHTDKPVVNTKPEEALAPVMEPPASPSITPSSPTSAPSPTAHQSRQKKYYKTLKGMLKLPHKSHPRKPSEPSLKPHENDTSTHHKKSSSDTSSIKSAEKRAALEAKMVKEASSGPPRRFIIRPWESTHSRVNWERAPVAGAVSEVDAHCGIFFRDKNWDYDALTQRLAQWIIIVCAKRPGLSSP